MTNLQSYKNRVRESKDQQNYAILCKDAHRCSIEVSYHRGQVSSVGRVDLDLSIVYLFYGAE